MGKLLFALIIVAGTAIYMTNKWAENQRPLDPVTERVKIISADTALNADQKQKLIFEALKGNKNG